MYTDTTPHSHGRPRLGHVGELCADHLGAPFHERHALEQTVTTIRLQLAAAEDAGQWVFDHLSALGIRHSLSVGPPPHPSVLSAAFLVQPWTQRWRWARLPSSAPSAAGQADDPGTSTDTVVQQVSPASRTALVRLVAEADDEVHDTHVQMVDLCEDGRRRHRPAVVHVRRLGPPEDPQVVGVWLTGTHEPGQV